MPKRKLPRSDPFASSQAAVALLKQSAWTFEQVDGSQVFELRVHLVTPGVFTPAKADIPTPGLPTLDGFLSFVAFRAALNSALKTHPELAGELLWQWNAALRDSALWVEFPLPLRQVTLQRARMYDCSVGLPVMEGEVSIPAGAFFARGVNLESYPKVADSVPLRRRVAEPRHRPLTLIHNLETQSGPTKLLDNRMYYALTEEFVFYFRGDASGVERLLDFARAQRIGMGKKTTLGYGQIGGFQIRAVAVSATFTQPIPGGQNWALVKALPYDAVLAQRPEARTDLFGCNEFRLINPLETLGAYRPPYWRRESQTQVLNYGTVLMPKQ